MNTAITQCAQQILDGTDLDRSQIEMLHQQSKDAFDDLLYHANRIRECFFGNKIRVCSIVPGRLGGCDQDCAFCAQSVRYDTHIDKKAQTLTDQQILSAAAEARKNNVPNLGIVYSGRAITEKELTRLESLIRHIHTEYGIGVCASLGIINTDQALRLVAAGVTRYNHNLETSERHFGKIVSTHTYADRIRTVEVARKAGLGVCCGGIFGIGENESDRIDMALELRRLGVDTVPMNFLHPIPGTPLGDSQKRSPREILRIIALYRFILPKIHLKVAGGRVLNLRDLQSWIFYAGCTSILTGNYLTTAGREAKDDLQMLEDLGLEVDRGK
ncbi:MAG: biotin synthase BioB [Sedimentisphaerales bacterium]|nr:biotin synthase BioB [Sedimentisphaerales bacterium]